MFFYCQVNSSYFVAAALTHLIGCNCIHRRTSCKMHFICYLFRQDVAAATFMAVAGTTPEFFTNTISTFIADSDMGIGTIMGSLLFNTLGVAGIAGLASKTVHFLSPSNQSNLITDSYPPFSPSRWTGGL